MPRVTTGLWSAMSRAVGEEIDDAAHEQARSRLCALRLATSHASLDDFEVLGEPHWDPPATTTA